MLLMLVFEDGPTTRVVSSSSLLGAAVGDIQVELAIHSTFFSQLETGADAVSCPEQEMKLSPVLLL